MRQEQEDLTRTLASALWRSAFSPYCRALDNWLAAQEMVAEALRAPREAPEPQPDAVMAPVPSLPSSALPVAYVRDLAQCFWEHSARSAALTLDIWLAAEPHVSALCRAARAGRGVLQPFSAEAYWQRIRHHAECLWLSQDQPRDRDLDIWLEAEAEVLTQAAGGEGRRTPAADAGEGDAPDAAQRPPLALTMLDEHGGAAVAPWYSPAGPEHHGARPSL